MEAAKTSSIGMFSESFFKRNKFISEKRKEEFRRLKEIVYFDHTGATLYAESQLRNYYNDLTSNVYGNPHSGNLSSQLTSDTIEQIRFRILRHFNTNPDEYSVIFTSGCTASLKLVADTFDFGGDNTSQEKGCFIYTTDNHTSVIGMRETFRARNININWCSAKLADDAPTNCECSKYSPRDIASQSRTRALFAYPAQSNFSGYKYPLSWINEAHSSRSHHDWYIVLDAASYVTTSQLNLALYKPDFVPISFYKMFGFPTGLGALLVRNGSGHTLKKTYFGGGTVNMSLASDLYHVNRASLSDRFEDGTVAFLDILALKHGFTAFEAIAGSIHDVTMHTFLLAKFIYQNLRACLHGNGMPVVKIYSVGDFSSHANQGGIVNFNLLRPDGTYIGYAEVDKLAQAHDIHLRTGCFCNQGACQEALGLTNEQLRENLKAGHVCGDDVDMINDQPTGSIRVSLGYMSTLQDVIHLINFIESCFVEGRPPNLCKNHGDEIHKYQLHGYSRHGDNNLITEASTDHLESEENRHDDRIESPSIKMRQSSGRRREDVAGDISLGSNQIKKVVIHTALNTNDRQLQKPLKGFPKLMRIFIYPVKSCAAFEVTEWSLGERGLLHDREWMVTTDSGACLKNPNLSLIRPNIDLQQQILLLNYKDLEPLEVPLRSNDGESNSSSELCHGRVCGVRIRTRDAGEAASLWLQRALGKPGLRLVSQSSSDMRVSKRQSEGKLSLANQAQYLLITSGSVEALHEHMAARSEVKTLSVEDLILRFRPNLVVSVTEPFTEDNFENLEIGSQKFVNQGPCDRCKMICYDPTTAEKSNEPLKSLATLRSHKNKFGILLRRSCEDSESMLRVGDDVTFSVKPSKLEVTDVSD